MKRIIDHFLLDWKNSSLRKSLLVRGARQVGKTYAIRQLGATFDNFVEVNCEQQLEVRKLFEKTLDPHYIIQRLSLIVRKPIVPGKTLLFIDEIQAVPQAIIALRYFYEMIPELHVIAAGSLLDFAIEEVGVPVGRVEFLYMHPVSFIEYVAAIGAGMYIDVLLSHDAHKPIDDQIHTSLFEMWGEYLGLGGMPQSIQQWVDTKDPLSSTRIHATLLGSYRQDFKKYARKLQIRYVELVFSHVPMQLGHKFKYSLIEGDYRKRELAPALDLLVTAGVVHQVYYSAGQGMPLGAQINLSDYKTLFLDVGLAQTALGLNPADWFLHPQQEIVNKGAIVEAFVGQELLAYMSPRFKQQAYYWHKEDRAQAAEIDYLVALQGAVVPIEVKSGSGRTLRSLQYFLDTHEKSTYGIRCSAQNYSVHNNVHSYPLYAIAQFMTAGDREMRAAINSLCV